MNSCGFGNCRIVAPTYSHSYQWHFIFDLHHIKTGLKIFVVVIPKEGMAGTSSAKTSFGLIPTIKLSSVFFSLYFNSQLHTKRGLGWTAL